MDQMNKSKRLWVSISLMWVIVTGIYTLTSDLSITERKALSRANICHMIIEGGGTATLNCYDHDIQYLFLRWGLVLVPVVAGWGFAAWVSKGNS